MARVCVSCGLTTDVDGRLIVNTGSAVWPFACAETSGTRIRCGSDGVLRLAAPSILVAAHLEQTSETFPDDNVPNTETVVATTGLVSVAPGTCGQDVLRITEIEFQVDLMIAVGSIVRGFIAGDEVFFIPNQTAANLFIHSTQTTKVPIAVVAAGTVLGQIDFALEELNAGGSTFSRVQWSYRAGYVTSQTP